MSGVLTCEEQTSGTFSGVTEYRCCCLMAWGPVCAEHEGTGARSGAGDTSEEGFIEAGAQELRQLYADASIEMCRLLSQQRLVLVLDLDHTLVNSARQTEIDSEHLKVVLRTEEFSYAQRAAAHRAWHTMMMCSVMAC